MQGSANVATRILDSYKRNQITFSEKSLYVDLYNGRIETGMYFTPGLKISLTMTTPSYCPKSAHIKMFPILIYLRGGE